MIVATGLSVKLDSFRGKRMSQTDKIQETFDRSLSLFRKASTLPKAARREALNRLDAAIRKYEDEILAALSADLNKSHYEGYMTEVAIVLSELHLAKKKLSKWMRPIRRPVALAQAPGKVRIIREPYGVVLVMSPWNYPFQLTLNPIIGALAGGNAVIVKPSAYSPHTSEIIAKICADAFPDGLVQVIQGGRKENQALLDMPFDYIFFTGSPGVGRVVMAAAASNLTPLTLELGGKSPVIVEHTADIRKTAKRILFGKLLNAGQTCVAPDHILCERRVKAELLSELKQQSQAIFADPEYVKVAWPKIITENHYKRILNLIDQENIVVGGKGYPDTRQIEFTILDQPSWDSPVMSEEIFGPVLPVLAWDDLDQLIQEQKIRPKPLALYIFSKNKNVNDKVLNELSFGGGCVNDTVMHLSSSKAPFGGVGNSGMGNYHGEYSFRTFTHEKTILQKWWSFDLPVRYHPYKDPKSRLPEILLR